MIAHRTYRGRCQLGRQGAIHRAALTANARDGIVDVSSRFPARNLEQRIVYDHIERACEARVLADRGVALYLLDGRTIYFWSRRHHQALLDQLRGSGVHVDKRVEYVAPMGASAPKI